MTKVIDEQKELDNLKRKRLSYSLLIALLLTICVLSCFFLLKFSKEKYVFNLILCVVITCIFLFIFAFYLINIYPVLNKRVSFYSGINKGEIESLTICFNSIESEIENDKHLFLYPLNVLVFDHLDKQDKILFSLKENIPFEKGNKYHVNTYQRVIISWEKI